MGTATGAACIHTKQEYIDCDMFFGDEAELTCRTVTLRKARKEHLCYGIYGKMDHSIQPGDLYRYERALVDGSFWGEYRVCLRCLDTFMAIADEY